MRGLAFCLVRKCPRFSQFQGCKAAGLLYTAGAQGDVLPPCPSLAAAGMRGEGPGSPQADPPAKPSPAHTNSHSRAVAEPPRPSSHLKLSSNPSPLTASLPLGLAAPPNHASASTVPRPQVNGTSWSPPHQHHQGLSKKKRRKAHTRESGGPCSEKPEVVAPPSGKKRKRKRRRLEDEATSHLQEEPRPPGEPPEIRETPLEKQSPQQPVNGWSGVGRQVGAAPDSCSSKKKKKRRRRESGGSLQLSVQLEATEGSPRKKKRKRSKSESGQEAQQVPSPDGRQSPQPEQSPPSMPVNGRLAGSHTGFTPDPPSARPRAQGLDVVQELLRYAADTAYGKKVLTWDGALSAVSQDAARDRALACAASVTDDWDTEFDRGKEKKMRKLKKEKKRNFNAFQKLQSRRNFWSVTHPAKAASLSFRR